jgi:hypothetical protein
MDSGAASSIDDELVGLLVTDRCVMIGVTEHAVNEPDPKSAS